MKRLAILAVLIAANAHAFPPRTFVSAQRGNDANAVANCAITSPCRTFAAAIAATAERGEVVALDSGGFGPFTIEHSVNVVAPAGVYAGITAPQGGTAIEITAPAASVVILRGLTINGWLSNYAVKSAGIEQLVVENCSISNFAGGYAVHFNGAGSFRVSGLSSTGNAYGVWATAPAGSTAYGVVTSSYFEGCQVSGVYAQEHAMISVVDSVATNGNCGFATVGGVLNCTRCTAAHNYSGFYVAESISNLRLNGCSATQNNYGVWSLSSGVIESMANNMVYGNQTDVNTTKTRIDPQ